MRILLCASLVFLFAATATAQFAKSPALREKPVADAKKADKLAEPPANAVDPAAGGAAAAPSALFAALDLDGDGVISKVELKKAIVSLKKLDADNDGAITLVECGGGEAAGGAALAGNDQTQWIEQVMAKDKNQDGKLTVNELTENERQMLQGADLNNDGAVDRQELAALANGPGQQPGAQGNFAPGQNGPGVGGRRGNDAMARFFQYDRNRDGRLTNDEVPQQARGMLQGGDANGDGAIDAGELQAISAKMGDRMKAWGTGADPTANGAGANRQRDRKRP